MRDLLRHRDFRLLFAGQTLSMFGDMAMLLVLAMWAKELTGSNGIAGSVFAALVLPSLAAPLGGVLIDRFKRRTVMIVVDVATAGLVLSLLFVDGPEDLWLIYVVAFFYGASLVAFTSARSALLHTMLPDESLGQANASLGTVRESLRLLAPLAGAALYAGFGGHAVALIDAATFLLSAIALAVMRVEETPPAPSEAHFREEASAGGRHLLASPVLRAATVTTVICMLAIGISESVFFAVVDEGLGRPVEFIGVLGAIQGVGAITAGLLITAVIRRIGELRPTAVGLALMTVGCLLTVSSQVLIVGSGALLFGAGLPIVIVCLTTTLQRRTPGHMQGRVFTTFELVSAVPQLLSILAGALLVTFLDYRIPLVAMATGLGLSAVFAALRLRDGAADTSAKPDHATHESAVNLAPAGALPTRN